MKNKIEVLCPAGDFEAVVAAVQNGADAVYLGLKEFSARQNAVNFDNDDLRAAAIYCHARGVLIYLTLNILVSDMELAKVESAIRQAADVGVDAIIVQDLGVCALIKSICKTMPIHASTQMAVHTLKGAQLMEEMGIERVVLARELSLDELKEIASNINIETEVFVHGALCMSVSGQCYMSAMIGARSGNRGNCGGTCRLPFTSSNKSENSYDLSLKDQCLALHIDELIKANITSIKIEGRMKRPEYVAITAKSYDDARNARPHEEILDDIDTMQAVFSRSGFTDGYLTNHADGDMFGYRQKEDVVSATPKVLKAIANSYKKEHQLVSVSIFAHVAKGENITLTMTDKDDNTVCVSGDMPQAAINAPMTIDSLSRSLSKLGGTPFFTDDIKADLGDGLVVPASALNELRRAACEELMQKREQIHPKECGEFDLTNCLSGDINPQFGTKIRARFFKVSQVPFEFIDDFEYIIIPVKEAIENAAVLKPYAEKVIVEPDRIMFLSEEAQQKLLFEAHDLGYTHMMCENLAHIKIGKEFGFVLHAGSYLNCFNTLAAKELLNQSVKDITLSFELELAKAKRIKSALPLGIIAYGYLPLMIMKNCPIKAKKGCVECQGKNAGKNADKAATLTDRMGITFPVLCHDKKYCEILNSSRLYLADRLNELGCLFATLYFTTETQEECQQVIVEYQNGVSAIGQFTRGLYYRIV